MECFGLRGARMKGYDFYHVAMAHVATNSGEQKRRAGIDPGCSRLST